MSIQQWLLILWARRLVILLTLAGVAAGGIVAGSRLPKTYVGKARIMIELATDPITGGKIEPRAFEGAVATQTALIQDLSVISRAAQFAGYAPMTEARTEAELRARESAARALGRGVVATNVPNSNLIDIAGYSGSYQEARKLAEAVRRAYIELSIQQQRSSAIRALVIMQQQMRIFLQQRTVASERRTAFERLHDVVLRDDGEDSDTETMAKIAKANTDDLQKMARRKAAAVDQSGNILALSRIDAALSAAQASLGPNHPQVQALMARRAVLAANVQAPAVAQNAAISVQSMMSQKVEQMLANRGVLAEGRMLLTEEYASDNLIRALAARIVTTAQQANVVNSGVTAVGAPNGPVEPIAPNFPVICIVSAILGLILGVQIAIVVELLNRRVRGIEDLARMGIPILSALHQDDDKGRAELAFDAAA
ncbi:chain length determinant protein [Sphingobium sp. CAP-1]|uniref:chain length determinant protein n=1 Tax=Sphingobium sp. CAP-1 TaxID=2676077 RepID=UPI0012BB2CA1|nr:chain length determinant protein [Sphingobium sp. CAP-1]QGP78196.1 chain length determinant protein [Sphingobium sp. CAP-1]